MFVHRRTHTQQQGGLYTVCVSTLFGSESVTGWTKCGGGGRWWDGGSLCVVCVSVPRGRGRGVCVGPPLADSGSGGGGIVQL